jgi:xylulokinase
MEGVTHEMLDNLYVLTRSGIRPEVIRAGGGGARSDLWSRIQADMYGLPVQRLGESEASALGGAMLAGVGAEIFASPTEAETAMVDVTETLDPNVERHARYTELHEAYDAAYDALDRSVFELLASERNRADPPRGDR